MLTLTTEQYQIVLDALEMHLKSITRLQNNNTRPQFAIIYQTMIAENHEVTNKIRAAMLAPPATQGSAALRRESK